MAKNIRYQGKFKVGDKVAIKGRVPGDISLVWNRPRTVKAVRYDPDLQANLYILGSNERGACEGEPPLYGYARFPFRSYMLRPWKSQKTRGRPRKHHKRPRHHLRRQK